MSSINLDFRKKILVIAISTVMVVSFFASTHLGGSAIAQENDLIPITSGSNGLPAMVSGAVAVSPQKIGSAMQSLNTTGPAGALDNLFDSWADQDGASFQNEPTVAINLVRTNFHPIGGIEEQVVAGANDYGYGTGDSLCGVYTSSDHGHSWTRRAPIPMSGYPVGADPVVRSGRSSDVFYYVCLQFNRATDANAILLWRSTNGGVSWSLLETVASGVSGSDFNDKPWIAVDTNTRSGANDAIYVCWSYFDASGNADIRFRRVLDAGGTGVSGPITTVSDNKGNQGCSVAVKSNGEVGVAWTDFVNSRIEFRRSLTFGTSFEPIVIVKSIGAYFASIAACAGSPRAFSYVDLETTRPFTNPPPTGTTTGYWIIAYSSTTPHGPVASNSGIDVFTTRSITGGAGTWQPSIRVNDDPQGVAGVHQFMPAATVVDTGLTSFIPPAIPNAAYAGTYVISWQDERNADGNAATNECRTWATHSHTAQRDIAAGGMTYSANQNIQFANAFAIGFGGGFIGDYQDISPSPGTVLPIFYDSRDPDGGGPLGPNQNIFVNPTIHGGVAIPPSLEAGSYKWQ